MSKVKTGALAVTACLLWSTAFAGVKIGLEYTSPFFLAGSRFLIAGLLLVPFSGGNYIKSFLSDFSTVMIVAVVQTVVTYGLFFTAVDMIPGDIAAIIVGSSPLITSVITRIVLKDEKFTFRKTAAVLTGVGGIVFVVAGRHSFNAGSSDIPGTAVLLISIVFSSAGNIFVSKRGDSVNPVFLNSAQLTAGGLILIAVSFAVEGVPSIRPDIRFISALLWLSFISAAAFSIWFYLLSDRDTKVSELNIWKFLIPVFGSLFSWVLIPGESPAAVSVAGMIIVSLSVLMYFRGIPSSGE